MPNVTKGYYKEKITLTYLQIGIVMLIFFDIASDFFEDLPMREIFYDLIVEGLILSLVLYTINYVWDKLTIEIEHVETVTKDLELTKKLAETWEKKSLHFVKEYQSFVHLKLESWNFTKSEKEIALFILQGKSSKDIAALRSTSERTIRNQCRSIYEKSKLPGKNEFSAYFLNELIQDISL